MKHELAQLRDRIRAIEAGGRAARVLPFGIATLDAALPGGGLALGALHEVMGSGPDEEDGAFAAAFAGAILARLARHGGAPALWCAVADDLYAPGLAACGLDPARLIMTRCRSDEDILWAMEEGLRSTAVAAVIGEVGALAPTAGRRLQLAGEASGVTGFVLRRWRSGTEAARHRATPSAAVTRWRVGAAPSRDDGEPGIGTPLWRVELLRCRGGLPAAWLMAAGFGEGGFADVECMEEGDAADPVAVAAELADRPAAALRRRAG